MIPPNSQKTPEQAFKSDSEKSEIALIITCMIVGIGIFVIVMGCLKEAFPALFSAISGCYGLYLFVRKLMD